MPLFGIGIEDFGGLDLIDDADSHNGAIDMLNIDLKARGRMQSRDGYTKLTTSAAPTPMGQLISTGRAGNALLGITGLTAVQAVNATTGVLGAISGFPAVPLVNLTPFGAPGTTTVAYGGTGTALATILKYNGAFANVATGLGAGSFAYMVNVTPVDNRLMLLMFSGIAGTDPNSTIIFSDAGLPETFSAVTAGPPLTGPIVQLTPGDGEVITGVCNFANQVYVFKETKFFVFTGTTSDAGGNPIFNYRTVNVGAGSSTFGFIGNPSAGPDGVYYAASDGIWRTTGGMPQKVSGAIDPLFGVGGPVPPYWRGLVPRPGTGSVYTAMYHQRLYMSFLSTTGTRRAMLVFDTVTGQWMYWDISANGLVVNQADGSLVFAYDGNNAPTATNDLGKFSLTATTDAGTAITARYRSSYMAFDGAGRSFTGQRHGVEKTIRETIVDGMGTVNYRLMKQWVQPANLPTAEVLTLGTSPQVAQDRDRRAVRARMFSWQIDGTAPWTIEKLVLNMRDIAYPTLVRTGV